MMISSSSALLHVAWITAAVAVCLALCTIQSRKSSSSSSARRASSRSAASVRGSSRRSCREGNAAGSGGGGGATAAAFATPAAKVSPTPSDTAKADFIGELQAATVVADAGAVDDAACPVTVIDVGTHGPIAPVFPVPDPQPPRRSLSVKHIRFAERLGRIRSRRWGGDDDEEAGGGGPDDSTLWTKTILLGERCRVPSGDGDGDDAMVRWKSYRPRQPRSTPVTRSNSFAGVDNRAGSCRPAAGARL